MDFGQCFIGELCDHALCRNIASLPPFMPENGMMHSNPLSPYILIVCANVLSNLIHSRVNDGCLQRLRFQVEQQQVTKLMFADSLIGKLNMRDIG